MTPPNTPTRGTGVVGVEVWILEVITTVTKWDTLRVGAQDRAVFVKSANITLIRTVLI